MSIESIWDHQDSSGLDLPPQALIEGGTYCGCLTASRHWKKVLPSKLEKCSRSKLIINFLIVRLSELLVIVQ
jgi:hypothetical protein